MITVRRQYYGHEHDFGENGDPTLRSMHFKTVRTGDIRSSKTTDTMQLGTFGTGTTLANPGAGDLEAPVVAYEYDEFEMQEFSERRGF